MTFKDFIKELNGSRTEGELVKTIFYSLLTSLCVILVLYYSKFRYINDFIPKYGLYLFLAVLSYAIIIPSVRQVRAYRNFACMPGMMIGMTIGMSSGFLAGFFVGATNGMFFGGMFGMTLGVYFGIQNGRCCGIMGIMEGIMAGFMGGLMGAMTSVMLINDHLKISGAVIFLINSVILVGLNYMIYNEMKENDRQIKEDYFFVILTSFILTIITSWLMVYGPRSFLFQ